MGLYPTKNKHFFFKLAVLSKRLCPFQEGNISGFQALSVLGVLLLNLVAAPAVTNAQPAGAEDTSAGNISAESSPLTHLDDDGEARLPNHIMRALFLDPRVSEASARVCQAVHRLGLRRAEARPQLSGAVSGGRRLAGRIKEDPGASNFVRRNTPEEEEIHRSGAHRRHYDPRENDNIYDLTLSLRHTFWDWGQNRAGIAARELEYQVARVDARTILSQRSFDLLNLGLRLRLHDQVLASQRENAAIVAAQIEIVQSRVEAGAGRLSELREARLIALDLEIEMNRLQARHTILLDQLATDFELAADDAELLVATFWYHRPDALAHLPAERTEKAHAVRLRMQAVAHEEKQIRGSRYPRLDGVLNGRVFDLTDYKDEYELVGRLEMRMPLYDGGAAKARLREAAWRSRELESSLETLYRDHNREMERVNRRFNDLQREDREARARLTELHERMASLLAVQGKTVSSPLQIAQVQVEIGRAQTRLVELEIESESVRANALFLAERLDDVLGLRIGESGC